MKYKNISKGILRFRAHDISGKKREFALKQNEEFESDREANHPMLEVVNDKKTKKGDK